MILFFSEVSINSKYNIFDEDILIGTLMFVTKYEANKWYFVNLVEMRIFDDLRLIEISNKLKELNA